MSSQKQPIEAKSIARVFAMYIGCKCFGYPYFKNSLENTAFRVNGSLSGVNVDSVRVLYRDKNGYYWDTHSTELFEDIKLLLKPISEISDEDAIEVAKILNPGNNIGRVVNRTPRYIRVETDSTHSTESAMSIVLMFDKNSIVPENYHWYGLYHYAVQYLIQQGYAVPLFVAHDHPDNGKTAIELGLAIDITADEPIHQS